VLSTCFGSLADLFLCSRRYTVYGVAVTHIDRWASDSAVTIGRPAESKSAQVRLEAVGDGHSMLWGWHGECGSFEIVRSTTVAPSTITIDACAPCPQDRRQT
jgi:hypothetical protein